MQTSWIRRLTALGTVIGLMAVSGASAASAQTAPGHDLCACYVNCEKLYGQPGDNPADYAFCLADCDYRFPGQICEVANDLPDVKLD